MDGKKNWIKGEVVFSSPWVVVWEFCISKDSGIKAQMSVGGSMVGNRAFRHIKSEAERRRETAIDELRDLIESSDADGYNYGGLAAVIYDAGWRKLEDGHDSNGR